MDWIQDLLSSQLVIDLREMYRGENGVQRRRTRIAILDSGYQPPHFDESPGLQERIHWKDFVGHAPTGCDQSRDLHGTIVLQLAASLIPWAEFYVARVASDSSELSGSAPVAAKPIAEVRQLDFYFDGSQRHHLTGIIGNKMGRHRVQSRHHLNVFGLHHGANEDRRDD